MRNTPDERRDASGRLLKQDERYQREPFADSDKGNKPHQCKYANCAKTFANKFLLKKHEFIHTGERPHECRFCKKRYVSIGKSK